jgi:hypothetical protein
MERYRATPDRPMDVVGREGPKAPRVDTEIVLCRRGHPRFHFECKRLGRGNNVGKYLGRDGLGCYLREEYAQGCGEGGMLGYVQSEDYAAWACKIETSLMADHNGYRLVANSNWESCLIIPEVPQSVLPSQRLVSPPEGANYSPSRSRGSLNNRIVMRSSAGMHISSC